MGEGFQGIPLEELRIDAVDWSHRAEHIRTRSQRSGGLEADIEPEWATEAARDPQRSVGTASARSIKVIGWSPGAAVSRRMLDGLLKVWLVPKDAAKGEWWGASACEANDSDRRTYEQRRRHAR